MENLITLKTGRASKVVFFYAGEEGTYISNCMVTLYSNGIAHVTNDMEEITTHISNIEIVWKDTPKSTAEKVVYLNKKGDSQNRPFRLLKNQDDPEVTT